MQRDTYNNLLKIATDYGTEMTNYGMIDPASTRRFETPQVAADRTGKVSGSSTASVSNRANAAGVKFRTRWKNPGNIFRVPRNSVLRNRTGIYNGLDDLNRAAMDFYNSYTPEHRKLFRNLPKKRTWLERVTGAGVRQPLMKDFGPAWMDANTMCNAVVAHTLERATGLPVMMNPNTGATYTVAEMNKMLHDSEPRTINGYTFTPVPWDQAKSHPGALIIDPRHMGIRVQNGENYGTLNASFDKGLDINSTWGDPKHAVKDRPLRYYVISR